MHVPQVAERTSADKKGGHLARRKADGRFILRESAMCPDEDKAKFEDVALHKFFNTNNLWVNLPKLQARPLRSLIWSQTLRAALPKVSQTGRHTGLSAQAIGCFPSGAVAFRGLCGLYPAAGLYRLLDHCPACQRPCSADGPAIVQPDTQ